MAHSSYNLWKRVVWLRSSRNESTSPEHHPVLAREVTCATPLNPQIHTCCQDSRQNSKVVRYQEHAGGLCPSSRSHPSAGSWGLVPPPPKNSLAGSP